MYSSKQTDRNINAMPGSVTNRPPKLKYLVLGISTASLLLLIALQNNLQAQEKTEKTPKATSTAVTKKSAATKKREQNIPDVTTLSEAKKITRQWMRKYDLDKDKLMSEEELAQAIYSMFSSSEEKPEAPAQVVGKEKKPAPAKKEIASKERMPKQTN